MDAPLPELALAHAMGAGGTLSRAATRQIRLTVFQLSFRAMYCASPQGFFAAFLLSSLRTTVRPYFPIYLTRQSCKSLHRCPWAARGCYEVCTKIGAYVGGPSYPLWMDGKPGESRL